VAQFSWDWGQSWEGRFGAFVGEDGFNWVGAWLDAPSFGWYESHGFGAKKEGRLQRRPYKVKT